MFAAAGFGPTLLRRARSNPAQLVAFALIIGGLAIIATTLSDSATVGKVFSVGLVLVLLVLVLVLKRAANDLGLVKRWHAVTQPVT